MSIFTQLRDWFLAPLMSSEERKAIDRVEQIRDYYVGNQKQSIKQRPNQPDYNAVANVIRTVIDDAVALLFGYGIDFDLPSDEKSAESIYLNEVWDVNKQEILLNNVAKVGAETGTCGIKITPDGVYSEKLGRDIPRLDEQDMSFWKIITAPRDVKQHTKYIYQSTYTKDDGKPGAYKQEIVLLVTPDGEKSWEVVDYELNSAQKWEATNREPWPYYFPPLVVWQNLPNISSPYGIPDITPDTIKAQDKLNFVLSDTIKTSSLYAHPKLVVKNAKLEAPVDNAPDMLIQISGAEADMNMLEMSSELSGSLSLFDKIKSVIFDTTGTVDTAALIGSGDMTNFRVKVAFQKALQKQHVKRELYGDAIINLNKYILILGGYANADPGEIKWPDVLPIDEVGQATAMQAHMGMGVVSKHTASNKLGYQWEDEQARIADEKTGEGDIGTTILNAFNQTGQ